MGLAAEGSSRSEITYAGGGTEGYYAPEFLITKERPFRYTNRVDIWALGCIVYELATANQAFDKNGDTIKFALSEDPFPRGRFPFDGSSANYLFDLIQRMLTIDKKERPSASEICTMLQEYTFLDLMETTENAYTLDDKPWLLSVGDELHHVRSLCNRASGNESHEVLPP